MEDELATFANGQVKDDEPIVHPVDWRLVENRLCSVCSSITAQSEVLDLIANDQQPNTPVVETWPHHVDVQSLKNAMWRGCHLCCLLYVQCGEALAWYIDIQDFGLPDGQLHLYLSTRSNTKLPHPRGSPRFHFEFGLGRPNQKDNKIRPHEPLLLERELPDQRPKMNESFLNASLGSKASLDVAHKWLSTCVRDHKHCANNSNFPEYLPRRLLKVTGTFENPRIQLVEVTNDTSREVAYMTLSYRWGGTQSTLRKENYISYLESIPFEELPRTLKDAAKITLRMGYNHLWIDALCIIQDDPSDWNEAMNMNYIYGNSICTISALSARSSADPCLPNRSPLNYQSCKLRTARGNILSLVSWRARKVIEYSQPDSPLTTLHRRGWTVQERVLTPRNLCFSWQQIYWQCCEASFSELDDTNQNTAGSPFFRTQFRKRTLSEKPLAESVVIRQAFLGSKATDRDSVNLDGWHEAWWRLVENDYTLADLTKKEDRWPAISGIVHVLEATTRISIIAGLWKPFLMVDLLWSAQNLAIKGQRIDNGQPTWSWLSVTSPVYQEPIEWRDSIPDDGRFAGAIISICEDDAREIHLDSLPYYWAPTMYYLVVEGPMTKFPDITQGKIPFEERTERPFITSADPLSKIVAKSLITGYEYWYADYDFPLEELQDAWVLQWTRQEFWRTKSSQHREKHISGLIVRPMDREESRWCRLGRFRVSYVGKKGKPIGPTRRINLF